MKVPKSGLIGFYRCLVLTLQCGRFNPHFRSESRQNRPELTLQCGRFDLHFQSASRQNRLGGKPPTSQDTTVGVV